MFLNYKLIKKILISSLLSMLSVVFNACLESRELRGYGRDLNRYHEGQLSASELGKKYYYLYEQSIIQEETKATINFLNKIYFNRRYNEYTKNEETCGITFFLSNQNRLVYKLSDYMKTNSDVILYLQNKDRWTGYAVFNNNSIKTEKLYNFFGELTHQFLIYKTYGTKLERVTRYRDDNEGRVDGLSVIFSED